MLMRNFSRILAILAATAILSVSAVAWASTTLNMGNLTMVQCDNYDMRQGLSLTNGSGCDIKVNTGNCSTHSTPSGGMLCTCPAVVLSASGLCNDTTSATVWGYQ
jgi:hypothetical protein